MPIKKRRSYSKKNKYRIIVTRKGYKKKCCTKRKCNKKKKCCKRKTCHKKRRQQKGGSLTSTLEQVLMALPGGTDIRDVYWSSTNKISNLWNNWNGRAGRMSPLPSEQPIGNKTNNSSSSKSNIAKAYKQAGTQASSKNYQAYN